LKFPTLDSPLPCLISCDSLAVRACAFSPREADLWKSHSGIARNFSVGRPWRKINRSLYCAGLPSLSRPGARSLPPRWPRGESPPPFGTLTPPFSPKYGFCWWDSSLCSDGAFFLCHASPVSKEPDAPQIEMLSPLPLRIFERKQKWAPDIRSIQRWLKVFPQERSSLIVTETWREGKILLAVSGLLFLSPACVLFSSTPTESLTTTTPPASPHIPGIYCLFSPEWTLKSSAFFPKRQGTMRPQSVHS